MGVLRTHVRTVSLTQADVTVHHDEGPAFWVLADPEGNEACGRTWHSRDA